jgi:hypothetical protein
VIFHVRLKAIRCTSPPASDCALPDRNVYLVSPMKNVVETTIMLGVRTPNVSEAHITSIFRIGDQTKQEAGGNLRNCGPCFASRHEDTTAMLIVTAGSSPKYMALHLRDLYCCPYYCQWVRRRISACVYFRSDNSQFIHLLLR